MKCQETLKGTCFGVGDIFIDTKGSDFHIDVTVSDTW